MKKNTPVIIGSVLVGTVITVNELLSGMILKYMIKRDGFNLKKYSKKKGISGVNCNEAGLWLRQQKTETVCIESFDGLRLVGHYFPAENAKRTLLMMHGWRANWYDDFGDMARAFHNIGCNMLIIEERAQGNSEGKYIGFGVTERYDCVSWAEYLYNRQGMDMPVYLTGISMGAATVMMASELDLPENVKGIIADCGYSSPYDIVKNVAEKRYNVKEFAIRLIDLRCRLKAHYSLKESSATEALKRCKIPVFFAHGDADNFVPCEMTYKNYEACQSDKTMFIVHGADHAKCFKTTPNEYTRKVKEFFNWN